MKTFPTSSLTFLALISLAADSSSAADLLGYYDFDDRTDPAVAAHGGDALPRGLEPEAGALPDGATLEDPHELHGEGIFLQDVYNS